MFSLLEKIRRRQRSLGLALLLALLLCLLLPGTSQAYAVLLRSDPASNAVLQAEPVQVRMWFSEDLNPTSSTASVVNDANQRVDVNGALVIPTDTREMDVSLRPDLVPGVYVVIWHTQSMNDGQVFSGAFPFSIANADGSVPRPAGALPDQNLFAAASTGQIDGVTIFRWFMQALVDLCVIFWLCGKVWYVFLLDPASAETVEQREIAQLSRERFARRFSLPILRILFLANLGVLAGQALSLSAGRWDLILSPTLLLGLLTNGNFGIFWLTGEAVVALAIMLETMVLFSRQHTSDSANNDTSIWLDWLLGLVLLIITTLTSYTTASGVTQGAILILVGGLYLLAAALWPGGMLYLALVYLPVLRNRSLSGSVPSLLMTLQRFSPLTMSAAIIMLLSGAYNAIAHKTSFVQLYTTTYGRVLMLQIVCIIALLCVAALQLFLLQPALVKDYEKYERDKERSGEEQGLDVAIKVQEQHVARRVDRLLTMLRYMLLPAVIIIFCMALMSVLTGSF